MKCVEMLQSPLPPRVSALIECGILLGAAENDVELFGHEVASAAHRGVITRAQARLLSGLVGQRGIA